MNDGKIIKEDERQKITMHTGDKANKAYIEHRIYDDKREIYKLVQKINHPNLACILSVDFDGDTVVREEFIEALSLADLMEKGVHLNKAAVRKIALGVVSAMEALHTAGIIHRDIKPDNILIGKNYHVWLIDFDIARLYRPQIKQDTDIRGTFGYAPLEQYGMLPTDFKTDIYAFGVTFLNLLNYAKINGRMLKIAEKCKRLDPSLRYENCTRLKKEICKKPIWGIGFCVILFLTFLIGVTLALNSRNIPDEKPGVVSEKHIDDKEHNDDTFSSDKEYKELDINTNTTPSGKFEINKNEDNPATELKAEDLEKNQYFALFPADDIYNKYSGYYNYSDAMIFGTGWECSHLPLFADGVKNGKIKLDNTLVDAKITLRGDTIDIELKDDIGNSLSHSFKGSGTMNPVHGYKYKDVADLFCMDITNDGNEELIVGIGKCYIEARENEFYSSFARSNGWCIGYDSSNGFKLYDGMMHTKGRFGVERSGVFLTASRGSDDEPYMFYIDKGRLIGADFGW